MSSDERPEGSGAACSAYFAGAGKGPEGLEYPQRRPGSRPLGVEFQNKNKVLDTDQWNRAVILRCDKNGNRSESGRVGRGHR